MYSCKTSKLEASEIKFSGTARAHRMADKMVSIVGIVFDARRNSEGDFDLNKCSVFGITKEVVKFVFFHLGRWWIRFFCFCGAFLRGHETNY